MWFSWNVIGGINGRFLSVTLPAPELTAGFRDKDRVKNRVYIGVRVRVRVRFKVAYG